jgi:hypothetical protein
MTVDRRTGLLIIIAFVAILLIAALANSAGPGPGGDGGGCPPGHGVGHGVCETD